MLSFGEKIWDQPGWERLSEWSNWLFHKGDIKKFLGGKAGYRAKFV